MTDNDPRNAKTTNFGPQPDRPSEYAINEVHEDILSSDVEASSPPVGITIQKTKAENDVKNGSR